jgi:N-acyl-D-amino-acid deacylase
VARFDLLITNGEIIDGTGGPSFSGDVGITGGRIAAIGRLAGADAVRTIDAGGKIVAPGHITQHAHYDAAIFWSPYCLDSGPQGVTSVLNANCGFSLAPVRPADRERTMTMLSTTEQIPVEQQRAALTWDWETFPEFMEKLRSLPKSVNIMSYLPLNPLLIYVMGVDAAKSRQPNEAELREIHQLIGEAMDHGAIGISASVMGAEGNSHVDHDGTPMPTDLLTRSSIVALAQALIARGAGIVQLFSNVGPNGDRETSEAVAEAARGSGVRVVHNILVAVDGHPEMIDADLAWIDGLRSRGLDVSGATLLHHGWVENGIRDLDTAAGSMTGVRRLVACHSDDEIRSLLADPEFVQAFALEYRTDGAANGAGGFETQTVSAMGEDPATAKYVGRTLGDIADETGQDVIEVLCDLALKSDLDLGLKSASFSAWDATLSARMLSHPSVSGGVSDGGAHTKSMSNGFYATELLVRLGREQKTMSIEELHYQLAFKIARTLGLGNRGAILPGYWADLVIYDLAELFVDYSRFDIVHDMPTGDWRRETRAGGYANIIVNGVETFTAGKWTEAAPGHLITPQTATQTVELAA